MVMDVSLLLMHAFGRVFIRYFAKFNTLSPLFTSTRTAVVVGVVVVEEDDEEVEVVVVVAAAY